MSTSTEISGCLQSAQAKVVLGPVPLTITKGVGPGPTLAWAGWRQPDIPVEVDTDRLETSRFKKYYANCVLLYFPRLNSRVLLMYTDTVEDLPGYPVQNYPSGGFLF
jgi:hypothetical protein